MKHLITLIVVVLMAVACGERETIQSMEPLSFIDMHCREHTGDFVEYTPDIYNECVQLHMEGRVKADSTDEHLNVAHY
jgi:hypothetical protein